jgi:hypothetical protein
MLMRYTRKTRDTWDVQGDYGQGWETVTGSDSRREAILQTLRTIGQTNLTRSASRRLEKNLIQPKPISPLEGHKWTKEK